MAKILIAGLGKGIKRDGKYSEANYSIENENGETIIYSGENFITSALEKHFSIDKTIYIGTVGSMWDNLYSYYCNKYDMKEDEDYTFELLETVSNATKDSEFSEINIEKFNSIFKGKAKIILTKFGMNTNEIFENFIVLDNITDIEDCYVPYDFLKQFYDIKSEDDIFKTIFQKLDFFFFNKKN